MEVKLSQAGLVGFFTLVGLFSLIDHLPRSSSIVVGSSTYGVAALVLHMRMKLTSLWEPSASLCVTYQIICNTIINLSLDSSTNLSICLNTKHSQRISLHFQLCHHPLFIKAFELIYLITKTICINHL